jgi:hypothetical protein
MSDIKSSVPVSPIYLPPKDRDIPEWRQRATSNLSMTNSLTSNNTQASSSSSPGRSRKHYQPTGKNYKPVDGQAPHTTTGKPDMRNSWRRDMSIIDSKPNVSANEEDQNSTKTSADIAIALDKKEQQNIIDIASERQRIENQTSTNLSNFKPSEGHQIVNKNSVKHEYSFIADSERHPNSGRTSSKILHVQNKVEQSESFMSPVEANQP